MYQDLSQKCIHTYIHTYIYTYIHTYTHIHIHTYIAGICPKNVTNFCVFFHICPKNVTNYLVSMYHVYHMYHVPYVSYVTNVFVYSHICLGICPQNVTNFCGCVLHASVVATVVGIPRSEVTLHVIGREAGCGWSPRFL